MDKKWEIGIIMIKLTDILREARKSGTVKVYRGIGNDTVGYIDLPTYSDSIRDAILYRNIGINKTGDGNIIQGVAKYNNMLDLTHVGGSQVNVIELLKLGLDRKILINILNDIPVRYYSGGTDYIEKDGIDVNDDMVNIEVIIFDVFDHPNARKLLRVSNFDSVKYIGWNSGVEYRFVDNKQVDIQ